MRHAAAFLFVTNPRQREVYARSLDMSVFRVESRGRIEAVERPAEARLIVMDLACPADGWSDPPVKSAPRPARSRVASPELVLRTKRRA